MFGIADGKIRYDGININKIKKDDLRRSLGIVLQDVNLFTGTVMVIAQLWLRIFNADYGLLNGVLKAVGLSKLVQPWIDRKSVV